MATKKLNYHLMPRKGWLNDPNGLVFFHGRYHIFYQADEDDLQGRMNKAWGHYSTTDFATYTRHELAILPDSEYDINGAYSGSAIIKEDTLYLFYTGNVRYSGNHDYIHSGREQNLICVESKDGFNFKNKRCLLTNKDYPRDCTKHVRDPKLFISKGNYHLLLGARLHDDTSCVLEYISKDLNSWKYFQRYTPKKDVGYMIECPDLLKNESNSFIMCCPQGFVKEQEIFKNVYDCGYYKIKGKDLVEYQALDYGFDFYAPQTFYNSKRLIMMAWIGMPDNEYLDIYDDWNQTLSMPRQIEFKEGRMIQKPIDEILSLRKEKKKYCRSFAISKSSNIEFEADNEFVLSLNDIKMVYKKNELCLDLSKCNCNRNKRYIQNIKVNKMSIFIDETVLEIFINDGRYTMTSRFYDSNNQLNIKTEGIKEMITYEMKGVKIL